VRKGRVGLYEVDKKLGLLGNGGGQAGEAVGMGCRQKGNGSKQGGQVDTRPADLEEGIMLWQVPLG
jgi:hypothetical protein